jgi:hypothetical protein
LATGVRLVFRAAHHTATPATGLRKRTTEQGGNEVIATLRTMLAQKTALTKWSLHSLNVGMTILSLIPFAPKVCRPGVCRWFWAVPWPCSAVPPAWRSHTDWQNDFPKK